MDCPRIVRSIFDPLYYFAHIQRQTIGLNGYLEAYVPSLHVGGPEAFFRTGCCAGQLDGSGSRATARGGEPRPT